MGFDYRTGIEVRGTFVANTVRSEFFACPTCVWVIWVNPLILGSIRVTTLPLTVSTVNWEHTCYGFSGWLRFSKGVALLASFGARTATRRLLRLGITLPAINPGFKRERRAFLCSGRGL